MVVKKSIEWAGRVFSLETGELAAQADGAVLARYGRTSVLATVVCDPKSSVDVDFFPLSVHYIEKYYASGRFPGGFIKRETKPSEREVLISRVIDRSLRPLFHKDFKHETQIVCTVLSYEKECDSAIVGLLAASAAVHLAGLPFSGVVAGSRVGLRDGKFVLNEPAISDLDLIVAGTRDGIVMVESEASELSEDQMLDAMRFGYDSYLPIVEMIEQLKTEAACDSVAPRVSVSAPDLSYQEQLAQYCEANDLEHKVRDAYKLQRKVERYHALYLLESEMLAAFAESDISPIKIKGYFHDFCGKYVRDRLMQEGVRIDGRQHDGIRPLSMKVAMFETVHGSALFVRGETQSLAMTTLGSAQDEQINDHISGETRDHFMLQYNFPPYSVGEAGRLGAPGRREIGHGKLATKALSRVLPNRDVFPYAIRVVSEILSCNGSSSMATVCSSCLSMLDAGVPLKNMVAGIAMGLVTEGDKYVILSDIMGDEDHLGDMDLKVAGSDRGITALQMDLKITGISFDLMREALAQAKRGRAFILQEMRENGLAEHRAQMHACAPRIEVMTIPRDKIRDVIGTGGKVIKEIIEKTGVKIDVEDTGVVSVFASDADSLSEAMNIIRGIVSEPVVGEVYRGKVTSVLDFGVFVNFFGQIDGLVHISEFSKDKKRVENLSELVSKGDVLSVKFCGYDRGKPKLTMRNVEQQ